MARRMMDDGIEDGDDTQGHRASLYSDAEIKHDVTPVGGDDDTEGNKKNFRVADGVDEGDDTEGNKKNFR